jgi:hypothetical protein
MKKLIFMFALFMSWQALACRTDQVRIVRSSGLGLSIGGGNGAFQGGVSQQIEIPLRVGAQSGCMTQRSGLDFEVVSKNGNFKGEVNIHPPQVEFKKVSGDVRTYIKLNYTEKSEKLDSLSLDLVSFTCSGESVIAVESYSGNLKNAFQLQNFNMNVGMTIAIGAAARNLRSRREESKRALGYDTVITEQLLEELETRMNGVKLEDIETEIVSIPSVYLSLSLQVGEMNMANSFSTITATKYGCSKKFDSLMKDLRIENIKNQLKNMPLKSKVKSKYIQLKWK